MLACLCLHPPCRTGACCCLTSGASCTARSGTAPTGCCRQSTSFATRWPTSGEPAGVTLQVKTAGTAATCWLLPGVPPQSTVSFPSQHFCLRLAASLKANAHPHTLAHPAPRPHPLPCRTHIHSEHLPAPPCPPLPLSFTCLCASAPPAGLATSLPRLTGACYLWMRAWPPISSTNAWMQYTPSWMAPATCSLPGKPRHTRGMVQERGPGGAASWQGRRRSPPEQPAGVASQLSCRCGTL